MILLLWLKQNCRNINHFHFVITESKSLELLVSSQGNCIAPKSLSAMCVNNNFFCHPVDLRRLYCIGTTIFHIIFIHPQSNPRLMYNLDASISFSCAPNWEVHSTYTYYLVIAGFFVPLFVILICYSHIVLFTKAVRTFKTCMLYASQFLRGFCHVGSEFLLQHALPFISGIYARRVT